MNVSVSYKEYIQYPVESVSTASTTRVSFMIRNVSAIFHSRMNQTITFGLAFQGQAHSPKGLRLTHFQIICDTFIKKTKTYNKC